MGRLHTTGSVLRYYDRSSAVVIAVVAVLVVIGLSAVAEAASVALIGLPIVAVASVAGRSREVILQQGSNVVSFNRRYLWGRRGHELAFDDIASVSIRPVRSAERPGCRVALLDRWANHHDVGSTATDVEAREMALALVDFLRLDGVDVVVSPAG